MQNSNLRNYFFLLSALSVFACSHTGIQSVKEEPISATIPDCQRNFTWEGGLISRPVFKTWAPASSNDSLKTGSPSKPPGPV